MQIVSTVKTCFLGKIFQTVFAESFIQNAKR